MYPLYGSSHLSVSTHLPLIFLSPFTLLIHTNYCIWKWVIFFFFVRSSFTGFWTGVMRVHGVKKNKTQLLLTVALKVMVSIKLILILPFHGNLKVERDFNPKHVTSRATSAFH